MAKKKKTPPKIGGDNAAIALYDGTVCYKVNFHRFGVNRKMDTDLIETETEKSYLKLQKVLLKSDEFDAIQSVDRKIKKHVAMMSLAIPFKMVATWLIPVALLSQTDDYVQKLLVKRRRLVDAFIEAYPSCIESAKEELKSNFNEDDYPTPERLRRQFGVEVRTFTMDVPEKVQTLDAGIYEREKQKVAQEWEEIRQEAVLGMREGFAVLAHNISNALTPEEGKRKVLKDTTVEKLMMFLETFSAKNIVGDAELSDLVEKAKKIVGNRDEGKVIYDLKDNKGFRDEMKKAFNAMSKDAVKMVEVVAVHRKINLDALKD